jgi:proline racemase
MTPGKMPRDDGMITQTVAATDYHTAGEPFRIVADVPVPLPGDSVADRRARALTSTDAQELRRTLCSEPRGHADMYGGFIVPPDDDGAHLGVLFWHKDGFSTACGHGTIALGAWAVDTGLIPAPVDGVVPTDPRLSGVYGTILHEELGDAIDPSNDHGGTVRQRNVTVFADGQVDRSPCGSGTAARLAVLADDGRVGLGGATLLHESIVGSTFTGTVVGTTRVGDLPAVIPQVTGMAYRTGEHLFVVDPADPLVPGFVLR